jgi:hypothetical protein
MEYEEEDKAKKIKVYNNITKQKRKTGAIIKSKWI